MEIEGKIYKMHANRMKKYHERIEQAIVNNCAVIYDHDEDFGNIELIETSRTVPS